MNVNLICALIRAHINADEESFTSLVLQLVAAETRSKHENAAASLRRALEHRPSGSHALHRLVQRWTGKAPPFVQTLAPAASLGDLVLAPAVSASLDAFMREHERREELAALGVPAASRLLFVGPPGNGKTKCAEGLAAALNIPLHYISIAGLVGSYLGETGARLAQAFEYAAAHPGLLFFDEIDAVGQERERDDIGEMRRVTNTFLQTLDRSDRRLLLVAATNAPHAVDRALMRRFDRRVTFAYPTASMVAAYVARRAAANFIVDPPTPASPWDADAAQLVSMAGLERAFDAAARAAVMAGERRVTADALRESVAACADRGTGA